MKQKIAAILSALMLLGALTACGGKDDGNSSRYASGDAYASYGDAYASYGNASGGNANG